MKLLMIVHGFAPECSGGTESYVLRASQELIRRGHEVAVLCGSHTGAGPGRIQPVMEEFLHAGIPVHRIHRTGLFVDNWEKGLAPEVEPLLVQVLKEFQPDLVHIHHWIRLTRNLVEICHDQGVGALCTLHDLWTTCPQAFRVHGGHFMAPNDPRAPCPRCGPKGESMTDAELGEELALFAADFHNELMLARRIIVPSNAHRDLIQASHPGLEGRFRVVPHGNIATFSGPKPSSCPSSKRFPGGPLVIGHWGHLSFLKGIDLLLDAVHRLPDPSRVKLEIFGEVVYPQEQQRINTLARGLNITWRGRFCPPDLQDVPLDLAVIPTRCSESWSFVLDEAFLLGLPAIVPNRGALAERLEGAGLSFRPESAASLGQALQRVLEKPSLLGRWRRRIQKLPTMEEHAAALERVYQEITTSRAPLPRTPLPLRQRRLQARVFQVEQRNRQRERDGGLIKNMKQDLARAQKTLDDMDRYHREKDRELKRLQKLVKSLEEKLAHAAMFSKGLLSEKRETEKHLQHTSKELENGKSEQERLTQLLASRNRTMEGLAAHVAVLLDRLENVERKHLRTSMAARQPDRLPAQGARGKQAGLKLLFVVHQLPPRHVAGTEVYTVNLARELAKRHHVLILSAESDHARPRYEESRLALHGLAVHQVIHNYKWDHFRQTYDCPEADAIFRRLLLEEAPDVVHIQHLTYWSANFITIARNHGIPVVYTLHDYALLCPRDGQMRRADGDLCETAIPARCQDCIQSFPLAPTPPPAILRGLHPAAEALVPPAIREMVRQMREVQAGQPTAREQAIMERLDYLKRVLADVNLFIAPSRFLREIFVASGLIPKERILVSGNGLDLNHLHPGRRRRFPVSWLRVGYVGSIAEHKGLDVLVEAMNLLEGEPVSCRIWGEPRAFVDYTASLRGRIENAETLLPGPFQHERLAQVLDSLDVLVVPSLWYENAPLTIHEAARVGLPVIVSDLGGMAEFVQEGVTGLKVPSGDAEALAAALGSLLESPGPLAAFDPTRLPQKSIQEDAQQMEVRYQKLLDRARSDSGVFLPRSRRSKGVSGPA